MGGMSSISSMIGKWEILILITLGQLPLSFFLSFFRSFVLSFFHSFLFFLRKQKLSLTVLHYRLVIHAYCKVEVKVLQL